MTQQTRDDVTYWIGVVVFWFALCGAAVLADKLASLLF